MTSASARPKPRRRPRTALVVGIVVTAVVVTGAAVWIGVSSQSAATAQAPGPGTVVVASDLSKAAHAAATGTEGTPEHDAAAYLAAQPTAFWLTPEVDPPGQVSERIAHLASDARAQSASLALVVYGLPGRDCGNHSAGGLAPDAYAEWTTEIGDALRAASDVRTIVVLEPDSLALAPECGNVDERVDQLAGAVDALTADSTWIYLDAGHSNWLPVPEMAALIESVTDASPVRGFATNVSNYNATDAEVAYAHALSAELGGLHAIIDTSRNGAGSDGQWCNPPGRRVGVAGGTIGDDVVDTNLWIKPPGESDGPCNGGPAAGQWWPESAVELTRIAQEG